MDRRAPWLAGLHRLADGSLIGLGTSVLVLAGLSLHWQHRWTSSYQALETTQTLEHRLQEATATLERSYVGTGDRPARMIATRTTNLVYLPRPETAPESREPVTLPQLGDLSRLGREAVQPGY